MNSKPEVINYIYQTLRLKFCSSEKFKSLKQFINFDFVGWRHNCLQLWFSDKIGENFHSPKISFDTSFRFITINSALQHDEGVVKNTLFLSQVRFPMLADKVD